MSDKEMPLPPIDLQRRGRMIAPSKTGYFSAHPTHLLAFNAGIYIKSKGYLWSGDLDVTRDAPQLQEIAGNLGETVYILREKDHTTKIHEIPWHNAIAKFEPEISR